MNTSPRRLPSALLLRLLLPPAPTRAEVFEANGWRIGKTVPSTTPANTTCYIDLKRIGPDADVVAYADERDPATTDGYGPDTSPPSPFRAAAPPTPSSGPRTCRRGHRPTPC